MHCIIWALDLGAQKNLASMKLNSVFLLGCNIQAVANILISLHIWQNKSKINNINNFSVNKKPNPSIDELNNTKYLAGIMVLKSSPEGKSFNLSITVSPFLIFCRSANSEEISECATRWGKTGIFYNGFNNNLEYIPTFWSWSNRVDKAFTNIKGGGRKSWNSNF